MPYEIAQSDQCPASKPWAVTNQQTGKVHGCHPTKEKALAQMQALYANEPGAKTMNAIERLPKLVRDLQSDIVVRKEADNVARLSFSGSSEFPVERWFGTEVLSHAKTAIRLARAQSGALPLLFNHNADDVVGMVDAVSLADGRTQVDAHLFDTARGNEVAQMIAGGLRNVSIGYRIHTIEENTKSDAMIATDWEPLEFSIASVPADPTVGIARAASDEGFDVRFVRASLPAGAGTTKGVNMEQQQQQTDGSNGAGVMMGVDNAMTERLRIEAIRNLARGNYGQYKPSDDDVDRWINEGADTTSVSTEILGQIKQRAEATKRSNPASLGLTNKELESYSITRAIRACVEKSWPKVAPFEADVSSAVAKRLGKQTTEHSFFVPLDVQWQRSNARSQQMQRDLIVGTATMGGYLVGTDVVSFIDVLRNRSVVMRLGATTLPGLQGSVSIPKQTASATAYWFADETGTATESQPTFGQLALTPKTVSGYVELSRQLLLQSTPNAEGIVNNDLAKVIALAVDSAAIAGPGTAGQPTGIKGTTGVGTANPSTGTAVVYADMIRFQSVVAAANAMMPGFAYVTTPAVAAILMGKARFTNSDTPIWQGNILDGQVVGAPAMSSVQIGAGIMYAGDFSQVVIGEWGVLEIETNPYAQFQAGIVGVRALYSCDVGVRYGPAFAAGTGMTG